MPTFSSPSIQRRVDGHRSDQFAVPAEFQIPRSRTVHEDEVADADASCWRTEYHQDQHAEDRACVRTSFHGRPLPPELVGFDTDDGKRRFGEALAAGTVEAFFPLAQQFATQVAG
jgi:hypothetical protein